MKVVNYGKIVNMQEVISITMKTIYKQIGWLPYVLAGVVFRAGQRGCIAEIT